MNMRHYIRERFYVSISKSLFISLVSLTLFACGGNGNGDGDGDSTAGFTVSGRVTSLTQGVVSGVDSKATGVTVVDSDYVYAVRSSPLNAERKKVAISADGTFSINLTKMESWILAFIDTTQTGPDMLKGIFKADQLDAISPTVDAASSTDVGALEIDDFGMAELPLEEYTTYVGDLGMTLTEASVLGLLDNFVLRYINPDMDGNGILDMDDPTIPNISIYIGMGYHYGDNSLLTNVQTGNQLPTNASVILGTPGGGYGAAIELRIDKTETGFYSTAAPKWSLHWSNSGNYTSDLDNTMEWTSPSPDIGLIFDDAENTGYKTMFPLSVTDVPDGTYTYRFYSSEGATTPSQTLTFTHVKAPDNAADTTNYVFPFPVFNVDENGDITSIDYTWMRKESAGFVPATSSDIELVLGNEGAQIWWDTDLTDVTYDYVNWRPATTNYSTTGSFTFEDAHTGGQLSRKRADIEQIAMTFFSKTGVWKLLIVQ